MVASGNGAGPHGQSTPVTVGSSHASPSNPSLTASQSHECRCLVGSASSSRSVYLALSSLSSPHSGSVSMVCGSGCCASSSSGVVESSGQLIIRRAPSLVIWATSSGMRGTQFAKATADLSLAQVRSLVRPHTGTHSASFLAGLYAKTLPSNTRALAMHK